MKRFAISLVAACLAVAVLGAVGCSSDDNDRRHHDGDRDGRYRDGPPYGGPHGPGSDPNERR